MRTFSVLFLVLLAGCTPDRPADVSPDASPVVIDAGVEPDAPDAAPTPPGSLAATAGGGTTSSAGHELSLRIGSPAPLGKTASSTHTLTTGPGAIPWTAP
jgi:hypothetical protein